MHGGQRKNEKLVIVTYLPALPIRLLIRIIIYSIINALPTPFSSAPGIRHPQVEALQSQEHFM